MAEWLFEEREGLQCWTIQGAPRRNILTLSMVGELEARLLKWESDPARTRVVILTGAGEQAFCAGADLKERSRMSQSDVRAFLKQVNRTFRRLEQSSTVFIAALNGSAFGGGLELALACDVRLAATHAEF